MPEDTRFTLPGVDDPPLVETGVLLMGLDVQRLLAGLAASPGADDPGQVALSVDLSRHGAQPGVRFDDLVDEGLRRWQASLGDGSTAPPRPASGSVRAAWRQAVREVSALATDAEPATVAYSAACWLRRDDIARYAAGEAAADPRSR